MSFPFDSESSDLAARLGPPRNDQSGLASSSRVDMLQIWGQNVKDEYSSTKFHVVESNRLEGLNVQIHTNGPQNGLFQPKWPTGYFSGKHDGDILVNHLIKFHVAWG